MIENFDSTKRLSSRKKIEFKKFFKKLILSTDISINHNIDSDDFEVYLWLFKSILITTCKKSFESNNYWSYDIFWEEWKIPEGSIKFNQKGMVEFKFLNLPNITFMEDYEMISYLFMVIRNEAFDWNIFEIKEWMDMKKIDTVII